MRFAQTFERWFREILPHAEILVSTRQPGMLDEWLERSCDGFGLVCVSAAGGNEPWPLFEAGSLTLIGRSRVASVALGAGIGSGPLSELTPYLAEHDSLLALFRVINEASPRALGAR